MTNGEFEKIRVAFRQVKKDMEHLSINIAENAKSYGTLQKGLQDMQVEMEQLKEKVKGVSAKKSEREKRLEERYKHLQDKHRELGKELTSVRRSVEKLERQLERQQKPQAQKKDRASEASVQVPRDQILIVGNKESAKVHYSTCPYAQKTKPENFVKFENLKEALRDGYHRCSCIFNN